MRDIYKTKCGHYFCTGCIAISVMNRKDKYSVNCAICRKKVFLNKMASVNYDKYSKIEKIMSDLSKQNKDKKENIVIYSDNIDICKILHKFICKEHINTYIVSGSKINKLKSIEKINNSDTCNIILVNSKDYEYTKYIKKIRTIIITDHIYRYILNKEALGYDYYNNKEKLEIIIYETSI
jgi:hypothetical protein